MTRTREEETVRARSMTPDLDRAGRRRSSSPDIADKERKLTSPVARKTSIVKGSGISKVSQLTHKNSMDFYPRRKSEFEKSKTFRKLQMELGESSPEPGDLNEESSTACSKQCRKRSFILDLNVYSSRHRSSSSSPVANRDESPECPKSCRGSESPDYRKKSTATFGKTNKTSGGNKRSNLETSTYSSRRRSSTSNPTDFNISKGRRGSREKSPELPTSRRESENPISKRKSRTKNEETVKMSGGNERTNLETGTYSSRRLLKDTPKGRRGSREKSPELPTSRRGSKSPDLGKKAINRNDETIKTRSNLETSTYSSRRHTSSPEPTDREPPEERRCSRDKSPEFPTSHRESESSTFRRPLNDQTNSSRRRPSSMNPTEINTPKGRKGSREKSPELPKSQRETESPIFQIKSTITTTTGGKTISKETRNERTSNRSESPVKNTHRPSESPRSSIDYHDSKLPTDPRRKSGTLRSVELVKKLVRSGTPDRKSVKETLERKTTRDDVEFPDHRVKSPMHKIIKKDKVSTDDSKDDKFQSSRKNSCETSSKTAGSRSRTVSPSPQSSHLMMETESFRTKKTERRSSIEAERNESIHRKEEKWINEINKIDAQKREHDLKTASPSPENDRINNSRRSSADVTVKRCDTFKVNRPSQEYLKVERESSVDDKEASINATMKGNVKNKSELFERIEKIRSTLSKSARSEQDLDRKDFERTDSVDSTLRRFDSIGVETEHQVTVGADETDRQICPVNLWPKEISRAEQPIVQRKSSVESQTKPDKTTVSVVKIQQRKIDQKSREPSREKMFRPNSRQKIKTEALKSVKVKKEKLTNVNTPRQIEPKTVGKPRASQKLTWSIVRKSKLRSDEESSGRGEGKLSDRSPVCKRRLFEDSDSEMEIENSTSTVVLSPITRVTKAPEIFKIKTTNNRENYEKSSEDFIVSESFLKEAKFENEQPAKLRSIEDIRKSIKKESQDFKRELNKFNIAMRRDEENSVILSPVTTVNSGIISCVRITKTLKPGDVVPEIKVERSTVKLPITRHRVAKSPSPDIGTKRARTPTMPVRRSVPSSPAKSPDTSKRV